MTALRYFEMQAVRLLTRGDLTEAQLELLARHAEPSSYEYTGSGYFVSVVDPSLPTGTWLRDFPNVVGRHDEIQCGFVVFLRDHELTLECHTWGGAIDVPSDFRDRPVVVTVEPINIIDLR